MSLVETLKITEQQRTAESQAEYKRLLKSAKSVDEYRSMLDRDDSSDAPAMVEIMNTLGLTAADVEADFEAVRRHRNAQAGLLDEDAKIRLRVELDRQLAAIAGETTTALTELWSLLPVDAHAGMMRMILAEMLYAIPENHKARAVELCRWQAWTVAVNDARLHYKHRTDSDLRARAEIVGLETRYRRVLSDSVPEAAETAAA